MSREHYETRASRRPKQQFEGGWLNERDEQVTLTQEQAKDILGEDIAEDMIVMAALHGVRPVPRGWRKVSR